MLRTAFNAEISALNPRGIGEVGLFRCLIKALSKIDPNIKAAEWHQKYIKYNTVTQPIKRELCDVLLILVRDFNMRFSFIQHKFCRKTSYNGLNDFEGNCGQHRLLVEKPSFVPIGKSSIHGDILRNNNYKTITAYSVFYKNKNGEYDLDYSCAEDVTCSGGNSFIGAPYCPYGKTNLSNLNKSTSMSAIADEYLSLVNIDDFEGAIRNFLIGERIDKSNKSVAKELMSCLYMFNESMNFLNTESYDNQQLNLNNKLNSILREFGAYNFEQNNSSEIIYLPKRIYIVDTTGFSKSNEFKQ